MSLVLFGHELYKDAICLASVLHAVDHFDHYVQMVCPTQTCSLSMHIICEYVSHVYVYMHYYKSIYYAQYMKPLKDPSVAQSFIHSVANSEEVFNKRPQDHPTLQELVEYIFKCKHGI